MSDPRRTSPHCGGFTLFEVLISVFILAVVLTAVYSAYTANLETVERGRQNAEVHQAARIALDRICKDLESVILEVPFSTGEIRLGLVGEDVSTNGAATDRLNFTSLSHVSPGGGPQTDLCEIGYYLEEPTHESERLEGNGYILYRRDDPAPDGDFTEGGSAFPLVEGIGSFNVTFESGRGDKSDSWDTREANQVSPAVIRVELTVLDRVGEEHLFVTSVHPPLAGAGGENGIRP